MTEDVALKGTELVRYLMERFNMTVAEAMAVMMKHNQQLIIEGGPDAD